MGKFIISIDCFPVYWHFTGLIFLSDELLMNYRLNPKLKLPSWYYHFDPHALYHAQTSEEEAAQRMMLFSNNAAVEADKGKTEEYVNEEMLEKLKNKQ